MLYHKWLNQPWLSKLKCQETALEIVRHYGEFSKVEAGDYIKWYNDNDSCTTLVTKISHFSNYAEYSHARGGYYSESDDIATAEIYLEVVDTDSLSVPRPSAK